jgi:hypothetical protein
MDEASAVDLWRRAAELQEEDARRADERARSAALQKALHGEGHSGETFTLEEVRAAAADAGIPAEYVELAWIEGRHGGVPGSRSATRREYARRRFLGTELQSMTVERAYDASVERVLAAMGDVFPNTPYLLELEATETVPADGSRVLVFAVPGGQELALNYTSFQYAMAWADIKKLIVTVRAVPGTEEVTELIIRSPLGYSRKLNYGVGLAFGSVIGLGGGIGGLFAGLALFSGAVASGAALAPVAVAATGLAGFGAGRSLTEWGWRAVYRVALRKGREGLEKLLGSVALHLEMHGTFVAGRTAQGGSLLTTADDE